MFSRIYSAQTNVLRGQLITIEVDISRNTLHAFTIVGLPDKAVDESKDRVSSAIKNSNFKSPKSQNQKIVISLSPADLKKEGSYFDLGIALAYLLGSEEIAFDPEKKLFLGELSLNGQLRPIKGALPLVEEAKRAGFTEIYLPKENAKEAALISGIDIYGAEELSEVIEHLTADVIDKKKKKDEKPARKIPLQPPTPITYERNAHDIDFRDIRGQESAKRGLEIAAAGGHNIAMSGPPGTGKTMLARAFADLLPDLTLPEILEATAIHSIAGSLGSDLVTAPPFRSPHHSSSYVSLVGGGTIPKPGEVTLAHRGVLFLDEFPEFEKRVIESLRQPLEDNVVSISRAKGTAVFPSNFILIAAMNPCPCGNAGSRQKQCICMPSDLARYARKISGPIMDRIDLWVTVGAVDYQKLGDDASVGETSGDISTRVARARTIQEKRFKNHPRKIRVNSDMNVKDLSAFVRLDPEVRTTLETSAAKLQLSARAYHRIMKLARTIADLEGSENVTESNILEALQYRPRQLA